MNVSSSLEHVSICTRCKDHDFDACIDHASTIAKLNDEIVQLNVQLKTCKNEVEKVKFARDAFTFGRHPSIEDGLGFQKGTKNTKSQKALNFTKKGKAPMANSLNSVHEKEIMLTYILMLRMFLIMLIMILVMIVLLFQSIIVVYLLLALCMLHL